MKDINLMDNLFFNPDIEIIQMDKSSTNSNYLLKIEHEEYVLRVPHTDGKQEIKRDQEHAVLRAIAPLNLDVDMVYYDETSGYKVTHFLRDARNYENYSHSDKLTHVASMMKTLHSLQHAICFAFPLVDNINMYQATLSQPLYDLSSFAYILKQLSQIQIPAIVCHNDWRADNILFSNDKAYLIDYECAANNHPFFDIMSFFVENNIIDTTQREQFYNTYFEQFDPSLQKELNLWENIYNLYKCYWAMMMFEKENEDVYRTIANTHYEALLASTCVTV